MENNGNSLSLVYEHVALCVLSQRQFEIVTEKVPAYALKQREDGYSYVASGWIKKKLFEAFGMDWDWCLIPIEDGKLYSLRERDEGRGKLVQYVAVMGQLTIRVRNPETMQVISTIVKTGVGSQVWRAKMELGDCIKGAKTDALRNAAFDLGIGFDYKWSDEAERERYDNAQKILSHVGEPQSVAELIAYAGVSMDELLKVAEVPDLGMLAANLKDAIVRVKTWKNGTANQVG